MLWVFKLSKCCCANVQATFEKLENEMKEINSNAEALKRNFLDLTELKHILRKTQSFFEEVTEIHSFWRVIVFTEIVQLLRRWSVLLKHQPTDAGLVSVNELNNNSLGCLKTRALSTYSSHLYLVDSVASLGWVTPGAATEGVTPLFFSWKTWRPFLVASSALSPLISSSQKPTTFFCSSLCRFLLLSLGCHPLEGVTLHLFYLFDLVSPLFFVNLPTKIFFSFGCHPSGGCHPGRSAPLAPA